MNDSLEELDEKSLLRNIYRFSRKRSGFPTIEEAARYRKKLEEKYFGKNSKEQED